MSELPVPLTPPECDLRGMEWMPLYGGRLFSSETWLSASPEARVAALALWWAAWQQKPAASVADDDRILAQLAGYGFSVAQWRKVKADALRGWVKCSDGRLYHPVVADLAVDAYERRCRESSKRAIDRERLQRWREEQRQSGAKNADETPPGDKGGNTTETRFDTRAETADETHETVQDRKRKKEPPSPSGDVPPSDDAESASRSAPKRREQIPDGWRPSERDLNFAACHVDADDLDREIAQFVDHHRSRGTVFRDVSRAWQTWCRNHSAWKSKRGPAPRAPSKLDWMLDDEPPRDANATITPEGFTLQ